MAVRGKKPAPARGKPTGDRGRGKPAAERGRGKPTADRGRGKPMTDRGKPSMIERGRGKPGRGRPDEKQTDRKFGRGRPTRETVIKDRKPTRQGKSRKEKQADEDSQAHARFLEKMAKKVVATPGEKKREKQIAAQLRREQKREKREKREKPEKPENMSEETASAPAIEETSAHPAVDDEEEIASAIRKDPYLLEEREDASNTVGLWTNKQRTLIFGSRGATALHRHLIEDLRKILVNSKSEVKWDKSLPLTDIVEAAELENCNNVLFFETRKKRDLYMYMAHCPNGPCMKFQVLNVNTMNSKSFMGNNMHGTRPLLVFDEKFGPSAGSPSKILSALRLMFTRIFSVPRYHPKSKPFYDHVLSFTVHNGLIYIRHYQIVYGNNIGVHGKNEGNKCEEKGNKGAGKGNKQREEGNKGADGGNKGADEGNKCAEGGNKWGVNVNNLREIGPQFILNPIRLFDQPFGGKTLWKNLSYLTPTAISAQKKRELRRATHDSEDDSE